MLLLHSILAFFHTVPGKILFLGTVVVDSILALLAVSEPLSNRALVLLSVGANLTVLLAAIIAGYFQYKAARIGAARFELLKPLVELPKKVTELSEGIDGVAHELKAAKEEGAVARVDAADARGQLKEREAETARQGAAALAKQDAAPAPVIIENPPEKPANVKQAQ